jgi:hypothetical protein
MMPHIKDLAAKRNDFWRGLSKTVVVILALAAIPVAMVLVALIWRFV